MSLNSCTSKCTSYFSPHDEIPHTLNDGCVMGGKHAENPGSILYVVALLNQQVCIKQHSTRNTQLLDSTIMAIPQVEKFYLQPTVHSPNSPLPVLLYRAILPQPYTEESTSDFLQAHDWEKRVSSRACNWDFSLILTCEGSFREHGAI